MAADSLRLPISPPGNWEVRVKKTGVPIQNLKKDRASDIASWEGLSSSLSAPRDSLQVILSGKLRDFSGQNSPKNG